MFCGNCTYFGMTVFRYITPVLFVLIWMCSPLGARGEGSRVLMEESFDEDSGGAFAGRLLGHPKIQMAEGEGVDGSNAIRVAYVGYERGSERVVVRYPMEEGVEEASLSFDVKFGEDFQWTMGGKLHGLGPAAPVTGGRNRKPEGWSARMMFMRGGRCSTYLYDQDRTKKWGVGDRTEEPVFTRGKWHRVRLRVRLNEAGRANGWARVFVDGREVVRTDGVEFRGIEGKETLIREVLFSTFHGGNTMRWTPVDSDGNPVTVYAWFDNFVVEAEGTSDR